MSSDRYICCDERRRDALLSDDAPPNVSGIDYVEVHAGATNLDPTFIEIHLVKPLPLPLAQISIENISLSGGVRYRTPQPIDPIAHFPGGTTVKRWRIEIPPGQLTDFSTYRLKVVSGLGANTAPAFLDARLNSVEFGFKLDCLAPGDCKTECDETEGTTKSAVTFDYRTRDYEGFRGQLLDRISTLVPGFDEDDPVDLTTTLVEALAYRADQLSYKLDWAGTEAFLSTARSRKAIARHARLMDYAVGEAVSARSFAAFEFEAAGTFVDGTVLPASTPLLPRLPARGEVIKASDLPELLLQDPIIFETLVDTALWQWRNSIAFHTWSDDECRLARGSTAATLVDGSVGSGALVPGDYLIFVETRSTKTGDEADARPEKRHVVRLTHVSSVTDILAPATKLVTVEWSAADALPFDLILQRGDDVGGVPEHKRRCAVALGNVVFCDHGVSLPPPNLGLKSSETEALRPALLPPVPPTVEAWTPKLEHAQISRTLPPPSAPEAAANWLADEGAEPIPQLLLEDEFSLWAARGDLLRSDRFDRHFVLENALDGELQIRFGDDVNGLRPSPGNSFAARGRFGVGTRGNIGHNALYHVVLPDASADIKLSVTNPVPATGGQETEPLTQIRINVPQAFREQERAVTEADYAQVALSHPEVANAKAVARWTGAWQTMMIYLDLVGGRPLDVDIRKSISAHLERYRLIGFDVIFRQAKMAPLEISLHICAKSGAVLGNVERSVRAALRPAGRSGKPGFFSPDNFSFGEPLYASQLIAFVMTVDGVESVRITKFKRADRKDQRELNLGVLTPGQLEILQLNDDPSFPEEGMLEIDMGGGNG